MSILQRYALEFKQPSAFKNWTPKQHPIVDNYPEQSVIFEIVNTKGS
jgi:hypothetical protein